MLCLYGGVLLFFGARHCIFAAVIVYATCYMKIAKDDCDEGR